MSDWDDLFASAAGIENPIETHTDSNVKNENQIIGKKRKKKFVPSEKNKYQCFEEFLESRMEHQNDFNDTLPDWVLVTKGLGNQCHSGYFSSEGSSNDPLKCSNCQRSALHHAFEIKKSIVDQKSKGILKTFLTLRNIRASCSSILMLGMENDDSTANAFPIDYLNGGIHKNISKLQQYQSIYEKKYMLPSGEQALLNEKFDKVSKCHSHLRTQLDKKIVCSSGRLKCRTAFNAIVRLMMACDDYYFRLYYLQVSGMLPTDTYNLPHPTTYFGTNYMVRDCTFCSVERYRMLQALKDCGSHWNETTVQCFGIEDSVADHESNGLLDPLTALHQHRFNETISIFWSSGWLMNEHTMDEYKTVMNSVPKSSKNEEDQFYIQHSTPAPLLLSQWRDSCRDLLCNLYGYAAITPAIVKEMKNILQKIGVKNIIEMGSGTGYLGKVLEQKGISIDCYDLIPPQSGGNEYHGNTPPFLDVKRGSFKNFSSIVPHHENIKNCSLLLCYPPPMTSMAKDTLDSFIKCGGKVLIHIGEFKGLTGSSSFEKKILSEFKLYFRQNCLSWGTDASTVTIWRRHEKHEPISRNPLIIPCTQCNIHESILRLRVSRVLSFCGKLCFEKYGHQSRRAHFQMSMIPHTLSMKYEKQQETFQIL